MSIQDRGRSPAVEIMGDIDDEEQLHADAISESEARPFLGEEGEGEPKDRFNLVYGIMFILGLGSLLPWNMFITANSYFQLKFGPQFTNTFESAFSVASLLPNFISSLFLIYLQSKVSFSIRLLVSLSGMLVIFIITAALTYVDTRDWYTGFFVLTLITVVIVNVLAAVTQSSVYGVAGLFASGKYTAAVMSGQALAGLFASIARILSIVAANQMSVPIRKENSTTEYIENLSALMYFLSACIVIVLCLCGSLLLLKLPFYKFHQESSTVTAARAQTRMNREDGVETRTTVPYWSIFLKVLPYGLSVQLVFVVTIALFPSVISQIHSVDNPLHDFDSYFTWIGNLFSPLVCFLLFNAADYVGRTLTIWFTYPKHWAPILILVVLRLIFFPLFALCVIPGTHYHAVFTSDVAPVVICLVFGISNGYLASISMIHSPSRVHKNHKETASVMASAFLTSGLVGGGALSFAAVAIIRNAN